MFLFFFSTLLERIREKYIYGGKVILHILWVGRFILSYTLQCRGVPLSYIHQGVTKRCWLTNSSLVYEPKYNHVSPTIVSLNQFLDGASLGRWVPWTMFPLDDASLTDVFRPRVADWRWITTTATHKFWLPDCIAGHLGNPKFAHLTRHIWATETHRPRYA